MIDDLCCSMSIADSLEKSNWYYIEHDVVDTWTYVHIYIYIYMCVHIYIYMCVSIYILVWYMNHTRFTSYNHMECIWNHICEYWYVDMNYMTACHINLKQVYMYK